MQTRNIILSLPENVLLEAEVLAARKGTSVSALLAGALVATPLCGSNLTDEQARRRLLEDASGGEENDRL